MPGKRVASKAKPKPQAKGTSPIVIVGVGHMGGAFARGLIAAGLGPRLILIDPAMKAELRCADTQLDGALVAYGDDVVVDNATGLLWQSRAMEGKFETWQAALDACANAAPTTCGAWRLPSIKELVSIMRGSEGTLPITVFAGEPTGPYRSSTPLAGNPSEVWLADYSVGAIAPTPIALETVNEVRCVR